MPPANHLDSFLEFARLEIATGGPDPHLKIAVEGLRRANSTEERVWRAACYVAPYEVSTGSVIWSEWPLEKTLRRPRNFAQWITRHWKGLCIRRERRAARTPAKMTECLLSAAKYASKCASPLKEDYELAWKQSDLELRYFGRYALIKFLQTLHQGGAMAYGIPDIRPKGGWSPRTALALICGKPDDPEWIESNDPIVLNEIQRRTNSLLQLVSSKTIDAHGKPTVSYFDIEVLLCNYRQAILRKYPGRPQDTDLAYYYKATEYWKGLHWKELPFPVLEVRRKLFPKEVLGEVQGWHGPREELGETYSVHGYFWCDLIHDYRNTRNLEQPALRAKRLQNIIRLR